VFEEMKQTPGRWMSGAGAENEIVLSSRVRLARNLKQHRFTHNAKNEELSEILEQTRKAGMETPTFEGAFYFPMGKISTLERRFLAERHLVSREFLFNSTNRGLIVNRGEDECVMINEEDHLRMQAFAPGFALQRAFDAVDRLDNELAPRLPYAFNDRLGYLTSCPTNLGTGLRVSVLIHLPGLVHSKEIQKLLDSLRKLNHSIRGLYGEGTDVMGNFFQLSNATTLGSPESAIVNKLGEVVTKVITYEKKAREMLFRKARSLLEDKVWRAYGLLQYSRSVSTKEALSLISAVRLGVGVGVITDLEVSKLNELLIYSQPAHLQIIGGGQMDTPERDIARAEYIRKILAA
jgi:protein arginine kinase